MWNRRALVLLSCVGLLAACSSSGEAADGPSADIAKVADLKSSFGPEFTVSEVPVTGIDPKLLSAQKLPDGLKFEPADCAQFAAGQQMPGDLKGNMAAVSAEGEGLRFIVIAMETNEELPMVEPADNCQKVNFAGGALRGTVEVAQVPQIEGVQTQAVHRVLQTTVNGQAQTGEIYSYLAHFGDYQVIVTANPLVLPDKPVVPVDTARAEALLTEAVSAIRS
ncbi:hypothetical protein BVC93_06155 [Mycobacterium sp. MS1601]|uniref:DUF5642 family protein n=1 Tax=Mycobacterium sp. MS1601 TaxID=1936029 RepID=UPI0009796549|nr:DUF5642 family protein [Mycobacterium sp. MS1601]AQA02079.1 hypothetical protein BVC93_06155 [Mycobacterium sp. MS1601]